MRRFPARFAARRGRDIYTRSLELDGRASSSTREIREKVAPRAETRKSGGRNPFTTTNAHLALPRVHARVDVRAGLSSHSRDTLTCTAVHTAHWQQNTAARSGACAAAGADRYFKNTIPL